MNVNKSAHIQIPRSDQELVFEGTVVPKSSMIVTLGVDFTTNAGMALPRQAERTATAMATLARLRTLSLPLVDYSDPP